MSLICRLNPFMRIPAPALLLPVCLAASFAAPLPGQEEVVMVEPVEQPTAVPQPVPQTAEELLRLYDEAIEDCRRRGPAVTARTYTSTTRDVSAHRSEIAARCLALMNFRHGDQGPAKLRESRVLEHLPRADYSESTTWEAVLEGDRWSVTTARDVEVTSWGWRSAADRASVSFSPSRSNPQLTVRAWDGSETDTWHRTALDVRLADVTKSFRWALASRVPYTYDVEQQRLHVAWNPGKRSPRRVPLYIRMFTRQDLWGGRIDFVLQRVTERGERPVFQFTAEFRDCLGGIAGRERITGIAGDTAFLFKTREAFQPGMDQPYTFSQESLVALPSFPFDRGALMEQAAGAPVLDYRVPDRRASYRFSGELPSLQVVRGLVGVRPEDAEVEIF